MMKKRSTIPSGYSVFSGILELRTLALPDPEHLRFTLTTRTLSGWFAVFHLDLLGTLDLHFLTAFHTVSSHSNISLLIKAIYLQDEWERAEVPD